MEQATMKTFVSNYRAIALTVMAGAFAASAHAATPCFDAKGNTITVMNLEAKSGEPHEIDVEHMTAVSSLVSSGSVAHNIQISNIKRDADKNVTTFDATIDDTAYQYPKDKCK
jgi:hypothetical protein